MKRQVSGLVTGVIASLALLSTSPGAKLVELDATALTAGTALPAWTNSGTLPGNFTAVGATPTVTLVTPGAGGGIAKNAITFANGASYFAGPDTPASIYGANARTFEVWVLNPDIYPEEGMIAIGRRGGGAGTNCAFSYGSHGTWGAVGMWDVADMNWGTTFGAAANTAGTAVTTGAPAANRWHHLVYTYDGVNARVYSDGVLANSQARTLNTWGPHKILIAAQTLDAAGNISAGAYTGANTYAASLSIARVRVHDVALSGAQIRTQYALEAPEFGTPAPSLPPIVTSFTTSTPSILAGGTATLVWNVFTDPGKDLTAISINNGAPAVSGNTGTVNVSPTTNTTYTLTATNADGTVTSTASVTVIVAQPLVAKHRWSFNEPAAVQNAGGAALADSIGGQNAFIRMVAPAKAVATGTGIQLSGGLSTVAPYIDLPNGMASQRVGGATWEGWMSVAATQNHARIFDFGSSFANMGQELIRPGGTGNGAEYLLLKASNGTTATASSFELLDQNSTNIIASSANATITFTANTEFHFALTYNPTGGAGGIGRINYYRNGAVVAGVDTVLDIRNLVDNNCWLGRGNWLADNNVQGTYNEFRVYDGPMAAADITASFNDGPNTFNARAGTSIKHRWSFNEPAATLEADAPLTDSVGGATAYVRSAETKLTGSQVLLTGGASATGSYIDLPNGILSSRSGEATFEGWATIYAISPWSRLMDLGTNGAELSAPGGTGNGTEYLLLTAHNGTPGAIDPYHTSRIELKDVTPVALTNTFDSYVAYQPGIPQHFAVTYRRNGGVAGGASLRHYRNGKLVSAATSAAAAWGDTGIVLSSITDVNNWLGRSNYTADANLNGSYDEFRVYDGAMSDEDVANSFGAGPNAALQTPLHIDLLTVTRPSIQAGESSQIVWQVANPSGAPLNVYTIPSSSVTGASGVATVSPTATTTYVLVAESAGQKRTQQVTVTVAPLMPTIVERNVSVPYQTATAVAVTGTDPRSLALAWSVTTPPASGTLSGTAPNWTYTPNAGFNGTDSFVVQATNGTQSTAGTIGLIVAADAPVAHVQTLAVANANARSVVLVAVDPDYEALTYSVVASPMNGSLTGAGANLTYTPNAGFVGTDSFTFKANDGTFDSNVATVTLNVAAAAAPTNITLSDSKIKVDDTVGTMIARLQAANGNAPETLTWALVSGTGDTNNADFTISGNQLLSNRNFAGALNSSVSIRLRATDNTGLSFEKVFTFTVGASDEHVKINEIFYNTPDNTLRGEFVEIVNPLSTPVDISGWKFTRGIAYTFPPGTILAPGAFAVVAEHPATLEALYGVVGAYGPWVGGLSSDGDTLELSNAAGLRQDRVEFGNNTPWPTGPNGDGMSLELINPNLDNDLGGHWRAATASPTASVLVPKSSTWSYRPGLTAAPVGWNAVGYTLDASWKTNALAPIGLFKVNSDVSLTNLGEAGVTLGTQLTAANAGTDMAVFQNATATVVNNFRVNYQSVNFRKDFTIAGPAPKALTLRIMRNDAAIVWINGVEVGRWGFYPNAPTDVPPNYDFVYELGNDPWMTTVLTNLGGVLNGNGGNNTIAIQGFAKKPRLRAGPDGQDVAGTAGSATAISYNLFDFSIDAELSTVASYKATPGASNSTFASNAAPAVRNVEHSPNLAKAGEPIVVTARVSDRQGVASVALKYQINAPNNYIPAYLPRTNAEILANIVANREYPKLANPDYELAANWATVAMVDDGSAWGDVAGDGLYTAAIPGQAHRTLVRYRVVATDLAGAAAQYPSTDDSVKNYAAFVYNGVPNYTNGTLSFSSAQLQQLPIYHMMMRSGDFDRLQAYNAADQFANDAQLVSLLARRFYNFECAMIYDGKVYDHVELRLRGGNSRYTGAGKRHYRFKFPKGYAFAARDNKGQRYNRDWEDMLFNKMFGNKGDYDYGLPYEAGVKLWGLAGVPMPNHHWVHFRVIRGATEAPAAATGDFFGLYDALELPEGKNFLKARDLPEGNFYKMSDYIQNGEMDERYQAKGAPEFAEDFENIRFNTHQYTSNADMEKYIDLPIWYNYNAVQEAIRHYDIFIEPTGRHRVKNLYWYFKPVAGNPLGQLVTMPYDWDSSFGSNYNHGLDLVNNAIYNYSFIPDSPTWPNAYAMPGNFAMPDRTGMMIKHRNAIRSLRDLVFYRGTNGSGPLDDVLNDAVSTIGLMADADFARWGTATGAPNFRTINAKRADMLNFSFSGWNTLTGEAPVMAGGRAAYLDSLADGPDGSMLPATPQISYTGTAGYPIDGLAFLASTFVDPQGSGTYGGIEWRIGEIAAPTATTARIYEAAPVWESGVLANGAMSVTVPSTTLKVGKTYAARVRVYDNTGRASHWSTAVTFVSGESAIQDILAQYLLISEIMYAPAAISNAEFTAGFTTGDFEYIELVNRHPSMTLPLDNLRFTKGIEFDFPAGQTIAPGQRKLVVKKLAAFQARYPAVPVGQLIGAWDVIGTAGAGTSLSNGGEQLKLSYGAGNTIHDLAYDDEGPWDATASFGGISLNYVGPLPDLIGLDPQAAGSNWVGGCAENGTPGQADLTSLAGYLSEYGLTAAGDADLDGWQNEAHWAFGRDIRRLEPTSTVVTVGASKFIEYTYTRRTCAYRTLYTNEQSTDLVTWDTTNVVEHSVTANVDGTETVVLRVPAPADPQTRVFIRARAEQE
jgi:hypothetical protein